MIISHSGAKSTEPTEERAEAGPLTLTLFSCEFRKSICSKELRFLKIIFGCPNAQWLEEIGYNCPRITRIYADLIFRI